MPPSAVGAPPRNAEHAGLHRDVSYVPGSAPGNPDGNPVKYRARNKAPPYKFVKNRDKNSMYYENTWFETEAAAIAALPAKQRRA